MIYCDIFFFIKWNKIGCWKRRKFWLFDGSGVYVLNFWLDYWKKDDVRIGVGVDI